MILSFDKFERYELPQVTLCNPNSRATEVDGKITITDTVGVLSNPKGMNLKLNFNAPHELSFDYYRHKSNDPIKQSFYDSIYESIQTDRYIYLTDIGYFIISSVTDSDEDNIDKKSISLKSCEENELATAEGLHLKEGTYYLHTDNNDGLLDLFLPKTAGWTMGYIDPSLLTKPYFVEDTEVDNGYNFLYTTIQDMYECIVEPDIIKRTINVYSRVYYAEHHLTDIHIAKYNLLKHKTVEENDEDKYTALNVQGKDENLEIRVVNPTGKNVIYNFEPRYSWMSPALQVAVIRWQDKCESVEDEYLTLQQGYYNDMQNIVFPLEEDIKVLELQLKEKELTRDTIIYGDYDKEKYDEIQDNALKQVNTEIQNVSTQISDKKAQLETEKNKIETNYSQPISNINSDCALDLTAKDTNGNTIFTAELLNELMTHIKPTDYVDEYMLVTESMTYPQRFEKAKELMDRAQSQLVKISSGQKTYSIDTRSFLFNKQFKHFSEQLCAGAIIYVETKNDTMEQLHLTGIDINFDEKSANLTLGNKYDRSDLKALYEDALGQNSKSFSELKYIASIIEDQQKQLDYQRNWVADLRTLTLDNVLTSEDQAIEINNRGLIGRKRQLNEDGSWKEDENGNPLFELEQVKLINNTLIFTKDNWNTASTAVGKIAVGYNSDGSVKYSYGINGQVLIGELILGNSLVLTGTSAGIKIKDKNGNDAFYADDNGNLVLSGTIFANNGKIAELTLSAGAMFKVNGWAESGAYTGYSSGLNAMYANAPGRDIFLWVGEHRGGNLEYNTPEGFDNAWTEELSAWNWKAVSPSWNTTVQDSIKNSAPFYVTWDGALHASNAYIKGNITATSGSVGGWIIDSFRIYNYNADTGYTFTLWNPGIAGGSIISCDKDGVVPFYVSRDGSLYAENATIKGNITATSGSFTGQLWSSYGSIGNWSISDYSLIGTASDGLSSIGLYAYPWFWHGGDPSTGRAADAIVVRNGDTYPFVVRKDGYLLASNADITGKINAGSVLVNGVKVGTGQNTSFEDFSSNGTIWKNVHNVNGGRIYLTSQNLTGMATNITFDASNGGSLGAGKWVYNGGEIATKNTGSDVRIKHDINSLSYKYDRLFDLLHPVSFIYNQDAYGYGTSQRTHIGFIANEVKESMDEISLSAKEFAGFVDRSYNSIENDILALAYEEFIALNTWQIQKLKKRASAAETRITNLEATVAELKAQLQTLTAG